MVKETNPYESPKTYEPDRWKWVRRGLFASAVIGGIIGYSFYLNKKPAVTRQTKRVDQFTNYAFEGESIEWKILVMDENKIDSITDVVATIGDVQGEGNN
ncbi:MAG: hypothetical protein RL557_822 [archaeon]|jgi:hypothetical protein